MSHIFISYSRADIDFARYVRGLLEAQGFKTWIDEKRLSSGMQWWDEIEHNIDTCNAFIIIMSPDARQSMYVNNEILRALDQKRPIFPLLYRGEPFGMLASVQYEDCTAGLHTELTRDFLDRLRGIVPTRHAPNITFSILEGNVMDVEVDVLAFKFARSFHGADMAVAKRLSKHNIEIDTQYLKQEGNHVLLETNDALAPKQVFYLSTPSIFKIGYEGIQILMSDTLTILKEIAPDTEHLGITLHGAGFGLDLEYAFRSQLAGIMDAVSKGIHPDSLKHITLIEKNAGRASRLQNVLDTVFDEVTSARKQDGTWVMNFSTSVNVEDVAQDVHVIPFALVMLPDDDALDDLFQYGIEQPVHAMGLLCERVNLPSDVLPTAEEIEALSQRITQASVFVLDGQSLQQIQMALFYLGVAQGAQTPIVLTQSTNEAPVTLPYENLTYSKISELNQQLHTQLKALMK